MKIGLLLKVAKNYFVVIVMLMSCNSYLWSKTLDQAMIEAGMVDVMSVADNIEVNLLYAGTDNFVGENMYGDLTKAYLHPHAAKALAAASEKLKLIKPGYRLKVTDAARPMSVQRKMYDTVRGTSKAKYVSNPANGGGLHNYGLAVDITIVDESGSELDMGTPVDYLGSEANINHEQELVRTGKISACAVDNRKLLRSVMKAGGFMPLISEWWHFNLRSRAYARRHYKRLDF